MKQEKQKEFAFTDGEFHQVREIVKECTGIVLSEGKKDMVYSRLSRRLRIHKLSDFASYLKMIKSDEQGEQGEFVNAITTNLTSFFREEHHFGFLRNKLLPQLMKENATSKKIRIWSAGCSTGEEPYSLAMTVRDVIPAGSDWDVKILACDLDSNVVNTGKTGVYTAKRLEGISEEYTRRWFLKGKGEKADYVRASSDLKDIISFKQLNLLETWPMKGQFDIIFCRNVVIYFDKETQGRLFDRFADILKPDGHLFIGHSENMFKTCDRFQLLGHTIYQRVK